MHALIVLRAGDLHSLPAKVDPERLMASLAMVESDGWKNKQPNFEPAFYAGGRYFNHHLHAEAMHRADPVLESSMGKLAASSMGPFQVMYPVAVELGFEGSPLELIDPRVNIEFAIRYLLKRVIPKLPAPDGTEEQIVKDVGDGYNTGNPRDSIENPHYERRLLNYYRSDDLYERLAVLPTYQSLSL